MSNTTSMEPKPNPNVHPAVGWPFNCLTPSLVSKNIVRRDSVSDNNRSGTSGKATLVHKGSKTKVDEADWYIAPTKKP